VSAPDPLAVALARLAELTAPPVSAADLMRRALPLAALPTTQPKESAQ
jgi:hypothetical protein